MLWSSRSNQWLPLKTNRHGGRPGPPGEIFEDRYYGTGRMFATGLVVHEQHLVEFADSQAAAEFGKHVFDESAVPEE